MIDLDSLVLGGGGAKGIVYPHTLARLHDTGKIDLKAIPHVIGSSAGALTGYILALGGTPYAIDMISPTISEALPFATKKFTNNGTIKIALDRATTLIDYSKDKLDGSSIPSVLLLWTRIALLHVLKKISEIQLDEDGYSYIAVDGEKYELIQLDNNHHNDDKYFWDYQINNNLPALRTILGKALHDLDYFGVYLASTHHKIVSLLRDTRSGWKHLTVTVTRLYSKDSGHEQLIKDFGSLNYVSSYLQGGNYSFQRDQVLNFLNQKSICLMAAAQASGAFPLLFPSTPLGTSPSIRDFLYTDGGCISNMPIESPILLDGIIDHKGNKKILALGLNNNNEAAALPINNEIAFVQYAMLPSLHKIILVPDKNSFFSKVKENICRNVLAQTENNHGRLFQFTPIDGKEEYQIFYISKEPNSPISLTMEIDKNHKENVAIDHAIKDYTDTVCRALDDLLQQVDPNEHWSDRFRFPLN